MELVNLPQGCTTVGCKWVLRKKLKLDGNVDTYKPRLIAKGYKQKKDLDFFDIFSLITRVTSMRVLIAIAIINYL